MNDLCVTDDGISRESIQVGFLRCQRNNSEIHFSD